MEQFNNKVVLITGGARGMGKCHVQEFVKSGARVVFTDILESEGKETQEECKSKAVFIKQDVSQASDWKSVADYIAKNFGHLDILINNAGIVRYGLLGQLSEQEFDRVMQVNAKSVFLGHTYMLELLKKGHHACVINISSIAGLRSGVGSSAYSTSKFAVNALTQAAALEWASLGIRVNTICPGAIDTPMLVQPDTKDAVEAFAKQIPLKRIGEPIELTKAVQFLASDDASYITGTQLVVDGGSMLI